MKTLIKTMLVAAMMALACGAQAKEGPANDEEYKIPPAKINAIIEMYDKGHVPTPEELVAEPLLESIDIFMDTRNIMVLNQYFAIRPSKTEIPGFGKYDIIDFNKTNCLPITPEYEKYAWESLWPRSPRTYLVQDDALVTIEKVSDGRVYVRSTRAYNGMLFSKLTLNGKLDRVTYYKSIDTKWCQLMYGNK